MRSACWLTKATNTHSEYIILIAFSLQKLSHERASMLRYTYISCIVTLLHCLVLHWLAFHLILFESFYFASGSSWSNHRPRTKKVAGHLKTWDFKVVAICRTNISLLLSKSLFLSSDVLLPYTLLSLPHGTKFTEQSNKKWLGWLKAGQKRFLTPETSFVSSVIFSERFTTRRDYKSETWHGSCIAV